MGKSPIGTSCMGPRAKPIPVPILAWTYNMLLGLEPYVIKAAPPVKSLRVGPQKRLHNLCVTLKAVNCCLLIIRSNRTLHSQELLHCIVSCKTSNILPSSAYGFEHVEQIHLRCNPSSGMLYCIREGSSVYPSSWTCTKFLDYRFS